MAYISLCHISTRISGARHSTVGARRVADHGRRGADTVRATSRTTASCDASWTRDDSTANQQTAEVEENTWCQQHEPVSHDVIQ